MGITARGLRLLQREGWRGVWHRLGRELRYLRFRRTAGPNRSGSYYGVALTPNWRDATFRMYVKGSYGDFYANHIRRQSQPFCFLDVGANQGLYALIAAQNRNCQHVFAFEPVARTAELLRRNVTLNGADARIRVFQNAISDSAGTATITLPDGHSGGASLGQSPAPGHTEQITTISRSELSELDMPTGVPILAKLDVEGHEETVLAELIHSKIGPQLTEIYYECDEDWIDPKPIARHLHEQGFRPVRKIGSTRHYNILALRNIAETAGT